MELNHPKCLSVPKPIVSFLMRPGKEEDSVLCPLGLWSCLGHGMDILGRSPPFSIPFQSGVGEGDNLGNRLAPSVCLCPFWRGKRQQCAVVCSISSSRVGPGPRVECGERRSVRIQSWESGESVQEEERAQRSFLLWALFPFPRVHAWPCELSQASFSVCGSQIIISLELILFFTM